MAGVSLMRGDCGTLLKSVEEAQEHAELTKHTNFSESTEAVLNLVCSACGKPCRSKTDSDLHTKRTGHTEFVDGTSESTKPISLEAPKPQKDVEMEETGDGSGTQQEVNQELLKELEEMGFPKERTIRALHYSGNVSAEAAVNWIVEHENDSDIDKISLVPVSSKKPDGPKPSLTPEEIKQKQQELRERARRKKEEEEKQKEREREKERVRVGRELLEAKRIEEENERKRMLALRKAEKEEEKRAREKIRQKLEEDKSQAQKHLHGLQFLGKYLSVERARTVAENTNIQHGRKEVTSTLSKDSSDGFRRSSEPIAEKLGVDYPFPPHFEYAYPPPDGHILTNIVNALVAVPRFYTQVLHLMNKMNIPAPFRKALPTPPLPVSVPVPPPPTPPPHPPPPPPPLSSETNIEDLSGSESEMESSDEEVQGERMPKRKRIKRQPIVGPAVNKDVAHETVGLKPAALLPKEKPILKKNNPILQIRMAPKQIKPDKKDDDNITELQETIQRNSDQQRYATLEELNSGKLPPEEILSLPRFKNYTTGDPTPVLYMKNLAKDVVVDDFYFIFGSFFGSIDEAKSNLLIKLMQVAKYGKYIT